MKLNIGGRRTTGFDVSIRLDAGEPVAGFALALADSPYEAC